MIEPLGYLCPGCGEVAKNLRALPNVNALETRACTACRSFADAFGAECTCYVNRCRDGRNGGCRGKCGCQGCRNAYYDAIDGPE